MKIYSNYNRKELGRLFLSMCLFAIIVYTPIFYFMDSLFMPFVQANNEYMLFVANDGYLERYFDYYEKGNFSSNLDKPSLVMFLVFQHIGGIVIPAFVLFFYLMVFPKAIIYLFKRFDLVKKEGFKISRKPLDKDKIE